MSKKLYKLTLAVAILVLAITLTGCAGKKPAPGVNEGKTAEKPVFKIGYLPVTHHLPLVVADKLYKDKYQNFELELVKFSSWPELTEALNSGQLQGAMQMLELAMLSAERGIPGEILALGHRNGDVFTVAPEINSIKDLKGQRVAIPHRMSAHYILLNKVLKDNGMTIDDVQWIEMPPPDMAAALASGDIKGFLVGEPAGAKAVLGGYGKMLVRLQDLWPNWICCGLVMNPETVKAYPEATQAFVDSLVASGNYIEDNRSEATKIAYEYMKLEEKIWDKSFGWGITYADLKPTQEDLNMLQSNLVDLKLLKGTVATDKMLNDTFVVKAYEKVKK